MKQQRHQHVTHNPKDIPSNFCGIEIGKFDIDFNYEQRLAKSSFEQKNCGPFKLAVYYSMQAYD